MISKFLHFYVHLYFAVPRGSWKLGCASCMIIYIYIYPVANKQILNRHM